MWELISGFRGFGVSGFQGLGFPILGLGAGCTFGYPNRVSISDPLSPGEGVGEVLFLWFEEALGFEVRGLVRVCWGVGDSELVWV